MEAGAAPTGNRRSRERSARLLGLVGVMPFAALALWLYGIAPDHPWRAMTMTLLVSYSAVVLSFLGGVRWGIAVIAKEGDGRPELALGVLPPLAGWAALAIPAPYTFAILAVAFAAHGAWDAFAVHAGTAPGWFGRLRMQLTVFAVTAMLVAFVATS